MASASRSVALDQQIFATQAYGGISRLFVELARELPKAGVDVTVIAPLFMNEHLRSLPAPLVRGTYAPKSWGFHALRAPLNYVLAIRQLRRLRPDIIHATHYGRVYRPSRRTRVVRTVFDMIPERVPECFSSDARSSRQKYASIVDADHVICISDNTKRDVQELFGISDEKMSVVPLGFTVPRGVADNTPRSDPPFVLFVGARHAYKNFDRLLHALQLVKQHQELASLSLVCFGGGAFTDRERATIAAAGLQASVAHRTGGDAELFELYGRAELLVYPSLYEGFGIPLLEAMASKCPVACSSTSCFPEVAGNAAEFFDPYDPESVAGGMLRILLDRGRRSELAQAGLRRCAMYSWFRCAAETAAVYGRLA
jgi:glycosyltransferase involved in cell wall biosynthesis